MKKCPECGRGYNDDSLSYCLDDGSELLFGPASMDEPATAILHETAPPTEAATQAQIHTTGQTSVPPYVDSNISKAKGSDKRLLLVPIVLAISVLGGYAAYRYLQSDRSGPITSIAVLPLQNKSGDPSAEYLSDGLAESLIYRLSQLPDLKVSPTSSVIQYKGKDTKVADIARELGVDTVMTGRLAQIGDNLTISIELVDVRSNKLLWGEQYERKMAELLTTQREIASEIANKLRLKLSGEGEQKLAKRYTDNNEAYQLYLKGRFYWNRRDEENLKRAIEQFKAAADLDPNYALAFVGLADSYAVLPHYSSAPQNEVLTQAKVYAERALQIDDSLGEAHTSLGFVHRSLWNWDEAGNELKRGIELSPNYATSHKWYANYLVNLGRFDESLAKLRRAQELEPLSSSISANLAELYLLKGDLNAAVGECRRAIDLDPNWYFVRFLLALAYLKQGRGDEALAEAQKSVELSKRQSTPLGVLGYIYAQTGKRNEAAALVEELKEKYVRRQANGYDLARVYTGLGENDQAFAWLEKDFESRNTSMPALLFLLPLDSLRGDPRFNVLVRRIGLPEVK